jgi:hypothetical protein
MFGPYSANHYLFSISQSLNGDYLLENNIIYDEFIHMGYQRFYVEGGSSDTASSLWYCGKLTNYSDFIEITGDERLNGFKAVSFPSLEDTSVTFCLDTDNPDVVSYFSPFKAGCTHCDCANWTIAIDKDTDTLVSQLSMSGSEGHTHSKHMWVTLHRTGPAPVVSDEDMPGHGADFSCNFEENGRDSEPVDRGNSPLRMSHEQLVAQASSGGGCPHMKRLMKPESMTPSPSSSVEKAPQFKFSDSYDHCYVINAYTDYRVAWTLDAEKSLLHVSISSTLLEQRNDTYVALGFRPMGRASSPSLTKQGTGRHMNFGMEGADIVVGSVSGGLRTLYAELYTGPPVPDNSLKISDATVTISDNRVVVSFTRPLVGGYLHENFDNDGSIVSGAADVIWAVGNDSVETDDSNTSGCEYHSNTRGIRFINWEDPSIAMVDEWKC